eukprot:scaffold7346_cov245-Pinguiococcus_pyrenoidosus.AAC.20
MSGGKLEHRRWLVVRPERPRRAAVRDPRRPHSLRSELARPCFLGAGQHGRSVHKAHHVHRYALHRMVASLLVLGPHQQDDGCADGLLVLLRLSPSQRHALNARSAHSHVRRADLRAEAAEDARRLHNDRCGNGRTAAQKSEELLQDGQRSLLCFSRDPQAQLRHGAALQGAGFVTAALYRVDPFLLRVVGDVQLAHLRLIFQRRDQPPDGMKVSSAKQQGQREAGAVSPDAILQLRHGAALQELHCATWVAPDAIVAHCDRHDALVRRVFVNVHHHDGTLRVDLRFG